MQWRCSSWYCSTWETANLRYVVTSSVTKLSFFSLLLCIVILVIFEWLLIWLLFKWIQTFRNIYSVEVKCLILTFDKSHIKCNYQLVKMTVLSVFVHLCLCLSVCLSVSVSVCLSVCLCMCCVWCMHVSAGERCE